MQGRWEIRSEGGFGMDIRGPLTVNWVPVVPCDDAAIERARQAIIAVVEDHLRFNVAAYGKAWTEEGEDTEFIVADAAEKALRAAGETPEPQVQRSSYDPWNETP